MEDLRLTGDWANPRWRISNLYWIQDEKGKVVPFRPNPQQLDLIADLWYLNLILKSRQHGFTTLVDILGLDMAVFRSNVNAGIIAHGLREAQEIFRTKVEFPYSRLPDAIKAAVRPITQTKTEFEFSNESRIAVGTSLRSGTYQFLHVSEFGKISRRYPDKAKEIKAGSFNAVHQGQYIFVESTAEGRDGHFYEMVQTATKTRNLGAKLTTLDFRLHFFPWWRDRRNRLDPEGVVIGESMAKYFAELKRDYRIELDDAQKAWYAKKYEQQGDLMFAEHPSTPDEAFKASTEGVIYGKQLALMYQRKLIGAVPHIPGIPVNTYWDLGHNDSMAVWFEQRVAGRHRFIRYFEDRMQTVAYYVQKLQEFQVEWKMIYGKVYLPHDAETVTLASASNKDGRNVKELFVSAGVNESDIIIVPRIDDLKTGHDLTRAIMPLCEIDQTYCDQGIKCLENYEFEWDERQGRFMTHPRENWAIHGADAFRQFAQGHALSGGGAFKRDKSRGWRAS